MPQLRFVKEASLIVFPTIVVLGLVAVGLHLLSLAPPEIERIVAAASQPEPAKVSTMVPYKDIKEAERILGMPIFYPTYLPPDTVWPPRQVSSDSRFPDCVSLLFISADEKQSLLFQQARAQEGSEALSSLPPPHHPVILIDVRQLPLGEVTATFSEGLDEYGKPDNSLEWAEEGYAFRITSTYDEAELLRVAGSIPSGRGE